MYLQFVIICYIAVCVHVSAHELLFLSTFYCPHVHLSCVRGGSKSKPQYSTYNFIKCWPSFEIISLSHYPGNFAIKRSLNIPPHLKHVATLFLKY